MGSAYQVVLSAQARNEALRQHDVAALAQLQKAAAALALKQGVDLSRLRLSDQGFIKKS